MAKGIIQVDSRKIRYSDGFICLTDMAKAYKNGDGKAASQLIMNWLQLRNTILFLGVVEKRNNPDFNLLGFQQIKNEYMEGGFTLSIGNFIKITNAKFVKSVAGRYGGTYVHEFIAVHFANWLSQDFYYDFLYSYKQLQQQANDHQTLEWAVSKITDNVEEIRNILDIIPGQKKNRNRLE